MLAAMAKPFGIDMPALIFQVAKDMYRDATITVRKPGTRTSGSLTAGTNPTEQTLTCKAIVEDYDEAQDGGAVQRGERMIVILASSIEDGAVPKPNDRVTIDGTRYTIVKDGVRTDEFEGIYLCDVQR